MACDKAALVSPIPPKRPAEKSRRQGAHSGQSEDKSGARMDRLAPAEQAGAFDDRSEQDKRNWEVNDQRMEAADELAEVAPLDPVRGSLQGGEQKHQYNEEADTT